MVYIVAKDPVAKRMPLVVGFLIVREEANDRGQCPQAQDGDEKFFVLLHEVNVS
jgi:hypothetical protein